MQQSTDVYHSSTPDGPFNAVFLPLERGLIVGVFVVGNLFLLFARAFLADQLAPLDLASHIDHFFNQRRSLRLVRRKVFVFVYSQIPFSDRRLPLLPLQKGFHLAWRDLPCCIPGP